MARERYTRRSYSGRPIPRHPAFPGLFRRERRATGQGNNLPRWLAQGLLVLILGFVALGAVSATTAYSSYAQVAASLLPRLEAINNREQFQTSRIYDRNGTLLYEFFDAGRRTNVALDEVSPLLIEATIAIEDKTFFTNTGVDYEGILRALYQNVTLGAEASGASTITQQVIKGIVLTEEERSYENRYQRKMTEIILAQELNERYSKNDILELYLNEIYYGNLAYGIQAASEAYFASSADELTLPQAALLAGLPQRPSLYDPLLFAERDDNGPFLRGVLLGTDWREPTYALPEGTSAPKWRQIAVLRQMVDEGYVDASEARRAAAVDLRFAPQEVPLNAPHFVFYVRRLLEERYGQQLITSGGLNIYTTLDLDMQRMVQATAREHIESIDDRNVHNSAVMVMQPNTGQVLAMVGSIDYNAIEATRTPGEEGNVLDGQVNVAVRERQPGSALKPFTYLSAMEQGMTPASILWDVPTEFPVNAAAGAWYAPTNYNKRWNGPVRIRTALAGSLNMPAVKALRAAGIDHTLNLLDRVGIREGLERGSDFYGLSLTLGGGEVTLLELTTAYNTLASNGQYHPPTSILRIEDNNGTVLEEFTQQAGDQVIDRGLVSIISDMLSDDRARQPVWGLNSDLKLTRPAAVKTGTTNDWRDAWTVGYAPYLTVGVWSGNNNNEPTAQVESIVGGGVIWHNVMEELFVWMNTQPRYQQLFAAPFPEQQVPLNFSLPPDNSVQRQTICDLPGPFNNYNEELFTQAMLGSDDFQSGCNAFRSINVIRLGATNVTSDTLGGGSRFCVPRAGASYPSSLRTTVSVWNVPDPDPDVRVRYEWQGGSAGTGNFPVCPANVSAAPLATTTPEVRPTVAVDTPPVAGAVRMPALVGRGENQARAALQALGVTSIVVDYQTRDRIPVLFDRFGPYVVVSTSPSVGSWILPDRSVILGIRAPEESPPPAAPAPEPPPAEPAPAEPAPEPPPAEPAPAEPAPEPPPAEPAPAEPAPEPPPAEPAPEPPPAEPAPEPPPAEPPIPDVPIIVPGSPEQP